MPPKVAAVTMAFNEAIFLPIWARHYARQVGADHCYVVDHGSTEALMLPPGVNTVRIPRSPHDDAARARFIGAFTASLLVYYDWIIHTDVDEIVVTDPALYDKIPDLCAVAQARTITAVGLDVQHVPALEADLDITLPIGQQRGWVRFTSAMCKPVLTRQRLRWAPGFHTANTALHFAGLYLFHLHWADRWTGLQRLAKTRAMPWGDSPGGGHQRVANNQWTTLFEGMAALPRIDPCTFDLAVDPLAEWLARTRTSFEPRGDEPASLDLAINAGELWAIPARFLARL